MEAQVVYLFWHVLDSWRGFKEAIESRYVDRQDHEEWITTVKWALFRPKKSRSIQGTENRCIGQSVLGLAGLGITNQLPPRQWGVRWGNWTNSKNIETFKSDQVTTDAWRPLGMGKITNQKCSQCHWCWLQGHWYDCVRWHLKVWLCRFFDMLSHSYTVWLFFVDTCKIRPVEGVQACPLFGIFFFSFVCLVFSLYFLFRPPPPPPLWYCKEDKLNSFIYKFGSCQLTRQWCVFHKCCLCGSGLTVDCSISGLIRISLGVRINFVVIIIEGGLEIKI